MQGPDIRRPQLTEEKQADRKGDKRTSAWSHNLAPGPRPPLDDQPDSGQTSLNTAAISL